MRRSIVSTVAAVAFVLVPTLASAQPRHCPPGLADRAVPCVPPGLARGGAARDVDRHTYLDGDTVFIVVDDFRPLGLAPPPAGTAYVLVEDEILHIAIGTLRIIDSLGPVAQLLN